MAVFGLLRQPATGERLCSFYSVVWGLRRSSVREWGHESGLFKGPGNGQKWRCKAKLGFVLACFGGVRCKVLIVANIDQTGKRRKVL